MKLSIFAFCIGGTLLSLPVIWLVSKAVFEGSEQAGLQARCIALSESVSSTSESIDAYYSNDGRNYAEFNLDNASIINAKLKKYRDERILEMDDEWHPVDQYYWLQDTLEMLAVVCPSEETIRQRENIKQLAIRHAELATTASEFFDEWEYYD